MFSRPPCRPAAIGVAATLNLWLACAPRPAAGNFLFVTLDSPRGFPTEMLGINNGRQVIGLDTAPIFTDNGRIFANRVGWLDAGRPYGMCHRRYHCMHQSSGRAYQPPSCVPDNLKKLLILLTSGIRACYILPHKIGA
jgi:hypothetical protein